MKAIRFHQHGGPEVLKYEDVPDPVLRKDQVLVKVKAVALNHLDLFVREGVPGVSLPQIPGSDIAGDIVECGEYITDLCEQTRQHAFDLLVQHANQMGANAVVGFRYDATEVMQGVTEVLAYGTAVVVKQKQA